MYSSYHSISKRLEGFSVSENDFKVAVPLIRTSLLDYFWNVSEFSTEAPGNMAFSKRL
jgi:hypothetical protein